ncbi:MAG: hypothetical protein SFX72_19905 [Isosphaeraceae bacterium]|nr:hypothetical protein [Isosphaeraceae bacterium]
MSMAALVLILLCLLGPAEKPLPLSAHNCYDGASEHKLALALELGIDNIEIDLGWDPTARRVIVGHDATPVPGSSYPRFEAYVAKFLAAPKRGDGAPRILTLDWKTEEPAAVAEVSAWLERHGDQFSTATKGEPSTLVERRFTVCFTGSDRAKEIYDRSIPPGGLYRAFRDQVFGGSDYREDPSAYFGKPADGYHRFATFHWGVIERGGPPLAGSWTDDERRRLEMLVAKAHESGFRVRFYCLNGGGPLTSLPYRFKDQATARIRRIAAAEAGVDWVATDDYSEAASELRKPTR